MSKKFYEWLLFGGTVFTCFCSCAKEDNSSAVNAPPIVTVTRSYAIGLPTDSVILTGSAEDMDGYIVSYRWKKVYGPDQYRFADSKQAITKVDKLVKGYYKFEFTATDDKGLSATKMSVVDVLQKYGCPCEPNCDDMGDPCDPWDY